MSCFGGSSAFSHWTHLKGDHSVYKRQSLWNTATIIVRCHIKTNNDGWHWRFLYDHGAITAGTSPRHGCPWIEQLQNNLYMQNKATVIHAVSLDKIFIYSSWLMCLIYRSIGLPFHPISLSLFIYIYIYVNLSCFKVWIQYSAQPALTGRGEGLTEQWRWWRGAERKGTVSMCN